MDNPNSSQLDSQLISSQQKKIKDYVKETAEMILLEVPKSGAVSTMVFGHLTNAYSAIKAQEDERLASYSDVNEYDSNFTKAVNKAAEELRDRAKLFERNADNAYGRRKRTYSDAADILMLTAHQMEQRVNKSSLKQEYTDALIKLSDYYIKINNWK